MTKPITGIFNILATPFDAALNVDEQSLHNLVEFQLDKGVVGLTILGVLGEAAKLSTDERARVAGIVFETVNGRVPVVVGTSHADLSTCISLSKQAFSAGATAVMIAPPRMPGAKDDDIIALYDTIASAVDQAIVVQDFPPVNDVIMTAPMLARLADQNPHARTLKLEDPPLMEKIGAIRKLTDKFAIFGGLGGMFLLEELERGAAGTMTGFAFSEVLVAVYDAFRAGDLAKAEAIFDRFLPLIRYENQPMINLTIRKQLLQRRGAIAHAALRTPFVSISDESQGEMDRVLRRVGIVDATQKIAFK